MTGHVEKVMAEMRPDAHVKTLNRDSGAIHLIEMTVLLTDERILLTHLDKLQMQPALAWEFIPYVSLSFFPLHFIVTKQYCRNHVY